MKYHKIFFGEIIFRQFYSQQKVIHQAFMQEGMNMKRLLGIGLIFVTALAVLIGGAPLRADYQALSITSIQCTNGLDPEHTPYLMLDDDPGTFWRTSTGSPAETGLEITLSARARILGIKLTCSETNFERMAIEYNDQGVWRTFTGQSVIKPTVLNEALTIDLSYDSIQTDSLRLHIYNHNKQYSYLGSIVKLEMFGIAGIEETAIPLDSIDTANSQDLFQADNLYDGNTNSTWETVPDSSGSASFILNFPASQINRLKLFVGSSQKGNLALSYWRDNKWIAISGAEKISNLNVGWNSISCQGITSGKIRGVFSGSVNGRLGGISEVEVWGLDAGGSKTFYDSGITYSDYQGVSGSLSAKIDLPQIQRRSKYNLIMAGGGTVPDFADYNGNNLSLSQPFSQNYAVSPVSLFKIPVQPQQGHSDEFNDPTLAPVWSWVRENRANWSLTADSGALTIHTEYGELLYSDNNMKNILLRKAPAGDWTISTKINAAFDYSYEQAGLIIYQDDDNYILMEAKYDYGQKFLCWKEAGGQTVGEYFHNATIPNPCYFKIVKTGNNYQCFYSADATVWQLVKLWENVNFNNNIQIGLIASNGYAYSRPAFRSSVQFDWFDLESGFRHPGGVNYVTLNGDQAGSVAALIIEEVKPNGLLSNWTAGSDKGLNDGLLFSPAVTTNRVDLEFDSRVQLDRLTIFSGADLGRIQVQAEGSSGWEAVAISQTQTGGACMVYFHNGIITKRLRLVLPAAIHLNEIQCWGSPVTGGAPQIRMDLPLDGQVLHPYDHTFRIMGRVDQTDAAIMVNGTPAVIQGERFSATLCPWQDNPVYTVAIGAQNSRNETTAVKRTVYLNAPPLLALDQTASEYYVKDNGFTVSGTVGGSNLNVTVNENAAQLSGLKFSQSIVLKEGKNLINVKAADSKGLSTSQTITVYRDSRPPQINILSPIDNQTSSIASLTVNGTVADSSVFTVKINGIRATINGSGFSGTVNLISGINPITVTAQDKMGNQSTATLHVKYSKSQPVLTVTYPADNQYLQSGRIVVQGTVTDTLPVMVDVNNVQARIAGDTYQASLTLSEGWNTLQARVTNEAGVQTVKSLKVMVDETRPLDFPVTANPADWANNNRPVLTFATSDKVSRIDHYELAVDDGAFAAVTSPYKLPVTADGEHTITVKAIDKAGWETIATTKVYIDTTPPVIVADFNTVPGKQKILISWQPNPESDLKSYVLKRTPAFKDGSEKVLAPDIHTYTDTEVEDLQSYIYSIKAVDHIDLAGPLTTTPTVKPGLAEVKVNPSVETKIEYENVQVVVPIGALPATKTLTITEVKDPESLLEKSMGINLSPVYSFGAATLQGPVDPAGVRFDKPVIVGIHYKLYGLYKYLNKNCFKAFYYNYKDGNWEIIPESYTDPETDTVYFFTKHFSMFSVQASTASMQSPEQISNMGISPGKAYYQNNQVGVSYASGGSTVMAKDFFLPGRGLDLTISRSYDSYVGSSDWGVDEKHIAEALVGFLDLSSLGGEAAAFINLIAELVAKQIDKYLSKPAGAYGFGRGWRMNFVWVEKDENGEFLHLPGGGMKKINWVMDGPGWGGQGHGTFECHAGEHFWIEQHQVYVGDIYSDSTSKVKIGENWQATDYYLVTKDGTKYYMNGDGKITRVVNRLGNGEINFSYRDDGKLDHIIDSVGRQIDFTYEGNFIHSISGGGKTVTYSYDNDELAKVNDGGLQETKYDYQEYTLNSGYRSFSGLSAVLSFVEGGPYGLIVYIISALVPNNTSADVCLLSNITTPFQGQHQFVYNTHKAMVYSSQFLGFSIAWYEVAKVSKYQEIGREYSKEIIITYDLQYENDKPPAVAKCYLQEGDKRTEMLFARYSNAVDENTSYLKNQVIYGKDGRKLSSYLVSKYNEALEVPEEIIDETGDRMIKQTFTYDNWGNVTGTTNSHTKVEAYYSYANTTAPPINNPKALTSPFGNQSIPMDCHDVKTGELILNKNGSQVIPQQTYYRYDNKALLTGKAMRWNSGWLMTGYEYDGYGNIIKMTSPTGIETYYEYPDTYKHALLTRITLGKLTDADDKVQNNIFLRELGYDPLSFRKLWEKDARGYVTQYQHDVLGRETMTVLPDDDDPGDYRPSAVEIDRSGYRANNPYQAIIYKDGAKTTTVIDPIGNRTDYIYDSFESLAEIQKYKKGSLFPYSKVQVHHDERGNITSIVSPNGCAAPSQAYKYTTRYQYDEVDRLQKIIYPDDTETIDDNPFKYYDYNDASNWVEVTELVDTKAANPYHRTLIKKDAVDRVTDHLYAYGAEEGFTASTGYDALGNKISETLSDGKSSFTATFIYDNLNRLTGKTLPAAPVLNDPDGSPATKRSSLNYVYDSEGNLQQETTPMGNTIIRYYDEMNQEIRTEVSFTALDDTRKTAITKTYYDLAGNKVQIIDPNDKVTRFSYTARGWLKTKTDPNGGVTSFTYDQVGNKLSETDPRGNAPGAVANSYTAWYFYDDLYRVIKAVLPDSTPPADPEHPGDNPVIQFEYDQNGNCVTETKANGQEILYTYDGRNQLIAQSEQLNGKTYTSRIEYDGVGNKRFVYDNKRKKTEYVYDPLNRLVLTVFPKGNILGFKYDMSGNKIETEDGMHHKTLSEYDALNRLGRVTDAEGKTSYFYYNEDGKLTKQISASGQVTKFYLNELGMPKQVKDSLNRVREFDYDPTGNVIYKKDPRGTESSFQYDDMYRLLQLQLRNGQRQQSLTYQYDLVGNVQSVSNGQVNLIYNDADGDYLSDPFNRIQKVRQVMPDGSSYTTQYQYDRMGQMTGISYPGSSRWLEYQYDMMGRVVGIPGFAGNKNNPGFGYDDNSALASIRTDNGITATYQRDDNGRITDILSQNRSGQDVLRLHYEFDDANNIISRNDNSYVYTKLNQLRQATIRGYFEDDFSKGDLVLGTVDQDYGGAKEPDKVYSGQAAEEDVTDQTQIKLDYAARSLIVDLKMEVDNVTRVELVPKLASHRVLSEQLEIYYRNGVGFTKLERNQWVGSIGEHGKIVIKFTPVLQTNEIKIHCNYDDLDFLQQSVEGLAQFYNTRTDLVRVYQMLVSRTDTYTYDEMGNRLTETRVLRKTYGYTYTYGPMSNRLKSKVKDDGSEKIEYAYDENGNLTSKVVTKGDKVDTWEYSYDLLNQLEQVKKNGVTVSSYIYDPNGFRVEKVGSRGRIDYVSLLNGEVGYRKEFSTNKEYSFIYVGGIHLARVDGVIGVDNAKKLFYANDHQGTALAMTDENGNKVTERDFAPFGERLASKEGDSPGPNEDDSAFTGKDWDADIELYYFNARWYDPEIGRFTSEDSVADDPNLYSYCFNNPVNMTDPTGHEAASAVSSAQALHYFTATMNAIALLNDDSNLSMAMSVFSLFLAINNKIVEAKQIEIIKNLLENNEPIVIDESGNVVNNSGENTDVIQASYNPNLDLGDAGESGLRDQLIKKGYTIIDGNKNTSTPGVDIAAYKDGVLYLIDVKESVKQGKVIYSVKGFQDPVRFNKWIKKVTTDVLNSSDIPEVVRNEIMGVLKGVEGNSCELKLVIATTDVTGEKNIVGIGSKLKKGINGLKVTFIRSTEFLSIYSTFSPMIHAGLLSQDINDIRAGKFGMFLQMKLAFVENYRGAPLNGFMFNLYGNFGELSCYDNGIQIVQKSYNYIMQNFVY
jgi:RHS repeat-associated protein